MSRRGVYFGGAFGAVRLAVLAVSAFVTSAASGDVVYTWWGGPEDYDYEIKHMPDLDQGRVPASGFWGLPNNGKQYCVPTSTMNMVMYIANHGHPQLMPGPDNWQDQSNYNAASINILVMGLKMGTGATTGTTGGGWISGAKAWFQDSNYDHFTIQHFFPDGAWCPTQQTITKAAIGGSLVAFAYGRYEVVDEMWGYQVIERKNGHIVTLAKSSGSSVTDTYEIWVRDPADSSADTVQSTFGNRNLTVDDRTVVVCPNPNQCYIRTMSSLNYNDGADRNAYIDEYLSIAPQAGYGFTNTPELHTFKLFTPIHFLGTGGDDVVEYDVGGPILDAVACPDRTCFPMLVRAGDLAPVEELWVLDPLTGEAENQFEIPGASKMVIDPSANLYVLTGSQVQKLEKLGEGYAFTDSAMLPGPADALTFIHLADVNLRPINAIPCMVALSITDMRVTFLYDELGTTPVDFAIPDEVVLRGTGAVAVEPPIVTQPVISFNVWMLSEASDVLYGVEYEMGRGLPAVEMINLPAIQQPSGIGFDDAGHMFVSTINGLVELMRNADGEWQVVEESIFAGFDVGPNFQPTRSQSNFDPMTMTGPAFYNIDPGELDFGPMSDDCPDPRDPIDSDLDGVPDWCDPCPQDNPDDSDRDGVCDSQDACPNFDNSVCDDGNDCTIDSCDPCVNDAAGADGNACATDSGAIGVCLGGSCYGVCGDVPSDDLILLQYAAFEGCLTGPGAGPLEPTCVCSDLNQDGQVDLKDYAGIQNVVGG